MGTAAAERIAILIDTQANLSGTTASRTALGQLSAAAVDANGTVAKSALEAAAQQEAVATSVNASIGAFEAYGRTVDVTNAKAVALYREQGDALAVNLVKLGATDAEVNRISTSIGKLERAQGAALIPIKNTGDEAEKMSPKVRTGANSLGILAQAAVMGTGSMAGLATAGGSVATSLATVSTNAKVAAAASGIGALVVVAGLVAAAFAEADAKTKEWATDLHNFGGLSTTALGNIEAQVRAQLAAVQDDLVKFSNRPIDIPFTNLGEAHGADLLDRQKRLETELQQIIAARLSQSQSLARSAAELVRTSGHEVDANTRSVALEKERLRMQIELNGALTSSAAGNAADRRTELQDKLQANAVDLAAKQQQITEQFRIKDASGQIVALTDEQRQRYDQLLTQAQSLADLKDRQIRAEQYHITLLAQNAALQGSDNPDDQYQGKLAQIEDERRADIARLNDITLANQLAAQKIKALDKDRFDQGITGYAKLGAAAKQYGSLVAEASRLAADAVRRYEIYEQARKDAQSAKSEFAAASAAFARGNVAGAALHLVAAGGYAAAAAFGGAEAVSGGGGGGGSGDTGGSSGSASPSTFTPQTQPGGESVVINLITQNPYTGESMGIVSYELNRAGVLKRPIYLPPTNGLVAVGA